MGLRFVMQIDELVDAERPIRFADFGFLRRSQADRDGANQDRGKVPPYFVTKVLEQAERPHVVENVADDNEVRIGVLQPLERFFPSFGTDDLDVTG